MSTSLLPFSCYLQLPKAVTRLREKLKIFLMSLGEFPLWKSATKAPNISLCTITSWIFPLSVIVDFSALSESPSHFDLVIGWKTFLFDNSVHSTALSLIAPPHAKLYSLDWSTNFLQPAVREMWSLDISWAFALNFVPKNEFCPPFSLITRSVLKIDPLSILKQLELSIIGWLPPFLDWPIDPKSLDLFLGSMLLGFAPEKIIKSAKAFFLGKLMLMLRKSKIFNLFLFSNTYSASFLQEKFLVILLLPSEDKWWQALRALELTVTPVLDEVNSHTFSSWVLWRVLTISMDPCFEYCAFLQHCFSSCWILQHCWVICWFRNSLLRLHSLQSFTGISFLVC